MGDSRWRVLFYNLGGGPHQEGDAFAFTEGGLVHALYSFSRLVDLCDTTIVCPNVPLEVCGRRFVVNGVTIDCPAPPTAARWLWSDEFSFTERPLQTILRLPSVLMSYRRLRRDALEARPHVILANGIVGSYMVGREWTHVAVVAVIHHLFQDPWSRGSDEATHGVAAQAEGWLLRHLNVDGIAVVNPAVRERLVAMGFDSSRIEMVGNGVDPRLYTFQAETHRGDVVYVGRLRKDKRVDLLIDMMTIVHRERPGTVLHIVGDGGQRRSLLRRVRRLGLEHMVRFHGYLSERKKVALMQSCSVYVSASRFEGFGIPLVEAMAAGTVPVVSDIPAHRFIFQGRDVGLMANSAPEMAARVLELLSDDKARMRRAYEGRRLVEELWTWDAVAARYRRLLEVVCGERYGVGRCMAESVVV